MLIARFLALLSLTVAVVVAVQYPGTATAATPLEADTFTVLPVSSGSVVTDSTATGGSALRLTRNGTASIGLEPDSVSKVVIRARGTQCLGAPRMTVYVAGKSVAGFNVTATKWTDYTANIAIPSGPQQLGIGFGNDLAVSGVCDRNLMVDTVEAVSSVVTTTPTTTTPTTTTPTTTTPTTTTPTTTTPTTTTPPDGSGATASIPFSATSPFRTPISQSAQIDPKSAAMVARMSRDNALYANLVAFGVPVYTANSTTPRYTVTCTVTNWGPCPLKGFQVPIPTGAKPSPGSDGAMVVVDEAAQRTYEFWQGRLVGGTWTAGWGAVHNLAGSGWGGTGAGTASGASRLGGVIRIAEIAAGEIPHALALQTDNACRTDFRPPAIKTDGDSDRADCIPEGARVRLDPAVDLEALNLTPAVRAVGRALQTYGAFIVDKGGAPLSISFEMNPGATAASIGSTYQQAGLRWDYDSLPGLPYNRLQVLE
ncbi:cell division septation protein DedD [Mycolicibacterium sp. 624]